MIPVHKYFLLLISLFLLAACGADPADHDPIAITAHEVMQALFDSGDAPGLAVAVGLGGRITWSEGFGFADVEQKVAVDPARTLFRIGSVIKPMTALAAAQLVQAGRLDLDAPVQAYVADFPPKQAPVTTRQLLAHLSGIRHYEGDEFFNHEAFASVAEGLAIFKDDPLLHPPGEGFLYSSYGYNLVSAVLEGAAGEEYLEYMSRNVFSPLGMQHTVPDDLARITPGRGRYYFREGDTLLNAPEVDNSYKWASGGYIGTVEDLARFGLAQLHDTPVNDTVRQIFWVEQLTNAGEATGYGLGWKIGQDENGREWISHSGGSVGGTTQLWINPESGLVIAMTSNLSNFKYGEAMASLAQVFLAPADKPRE
jgi:serine beta-lactamase-like protein LACTB